MESDGSSSMGSDDLENLVNQLALGGTPSKKLASAKPDVPLQRPSTIDDRATDSENESYAGVTAASSMLTAEALKNRDGKSGSSDSSRNSQDSYDGFERSVTDIDGVERDRVEASNTTNSPSDLSAEMDASRQEPVSLPEQPAVDTHSDKSAGSLALLKSHSRDVVPLSVSAQTNTSALGVQPSNSALVFPSPLQSGYATLMSSAASLHSMTQTSKINPPELVTEVNSPPPSIRVSLREEKPRSSLVPPRYGSSSSLLQPLPPIGGVTSSSSRPQDVLNRSLEEQGFSQISLLDPMAMMETLQDVLHQFAERGRAIENLVLADRRDRNGNAGAEAALEEKVEDLKRSLAASEGRARELDEQMAVAKSEAASTIKSLKTEITNLGQQLKHSEHRVKAKETVVEKLLSKLHNEVDRDAQRRSSEKDLLSKARADAQKHHRSSSGRSHTKHSSGSSSHSTQNSEARLASIVTAYEAEKERLQNDRSSLREEVTRLAEALRIAEEQKAGTWAPGFEPGMVETDQERRSREIAAEEKERAAELERGLRETRLREEKLQRRLERLAEALEAAEADRDKVTSALTNLEMEVESRPSLKTWRETQFRIEELQQKLAKAQGEAREANDIRRLRKMTDTRALMLADKDNTRLGLGAIDYIPTDALKELVKDVCRRLGVKGTDEIGNSIDKLVKVVRVVPRLSAVVNGVCRAVFEGKESRPMEQVVHLVESLVMFRQCVVEELAELKSANVLEDDQSVLKTIRALVQLQRKVARQART